MGKGASFNLDTLLTALFDPRIIRVSRAQGAVLPGYGPSNNKK
jgi:hypothetical protein